MNYPVQLQGVIYQRLKNMMVPEMEVSESEPFSLTIGWPRPFLILDTMYKCVLQYYGQIGPSVQIRNV